MNQAAVHAPHHRFGLLLGERNRARDLHAEVAHPRRLLELLRCGSNLNSTFRQISRSQILRGIKSRAGAERCQQQLGRSHAAVAAAILRRLIASDSVRPRLNVEPYALNLRNLHFHTALASYLKEAR